MRRRKKIVEYSLTVLLLSAGILAYFLIQKNGLTGISPGPEILDRNLREALNYYRLEEYARCELLLQHVLAQTGKRRTKSLAALYLGNIYFKKNATAKAVSLYRESISYNRKNVAAIYNLAVALSKTGRWAQSRETVQKLLEIQPGFRKGILFLGNLYYAAGQFEAAENLYAQKQDDPVFLFNLAMVYGRMNRREASIKLLARLASSPDADGALRGAAAYKCAVLTQRENPNGSVQYLKEARTTFPDSYTVQYTLAHVLMRTMQFKEAAGILQSIAADPDYAGRNEDVSLLYSLALMKSGRYADALDFIVRAYRMTGDERSAQIAGDIFLELGDFEQAKNYYNEAIEKQAGQSAYANLIQIYIHQGAYKQALSACDDFAQHFPDSMMPLVCKADVLFSLGDVKKAHEYIRQAAGDDPSDLVIAADLYRRHGRYDNALDLYGRVLAREPENMQVGEKIAETYMATGHTDRARSIYEKIRRAASDPIRYYRSTIALASLAEGERARLLYDELIQDFPYRYEAYYNQALLLLKSGGYAEALRIIKQCLEKNSGLAAPVLSKLYSLSGAAYMYMNRFEDAAGALTTARTLDGNNIEAAQCLEILGSIAR